MPVFFFFTQYERRRSMIDSLSLKLAEGLKKHVPDHKASIPVLKRGLDVILNTVGILVMSLGISLITGNTREVVIILLSFGLLRQLSGGFHLQSNVGCILLSSFLFTSLSFLQPGQAITVALTCISIVLVLFFAPSGITGYTRIRPKYYPALRISSAVLVASNLFILSPVVAVSFFAQSLTLIHRIGGESRHG
ncbi:hypothetical protein CHH75_04155 [Paenibacillus sp. 7541]|uniref:Accessory regulator AgrB n=2 Tax=Paenibacillus TaxID=44249 RepID=A0ABW9SV60_9BACL|nr:accessory regulator AgrB [Paenibacillus campinasensis]PAK55443.1 hypothetical protein CHH75_04155 [Paenibacillus sp. 7541]